MILAARSLDKLETEAAALRANGSTTLAVHLDVADPASVDRAAARILDRFGHVDVAINFAGNAGGLGLWQDVRPISSAP